MQHWTAPVAQIECTDVGIDKKKKKGVQGGCRKWEKGIIADLTNGLGKRPKGK